MPHSINPVTFSVNVAVTLNGALTVVADADVKVTVGTTVSTTMAALSAKDCPAGIVKVALFPAVSFKVAPGAKVILFELRSRLFCPVAGV
jgi:hypothetical protein